MEFGSKLGIELLEDERVKELRLIKEAYVCTNACWHCTNSAKALKMDLDPKDDEAHGNINIEVTVVQGADKGGGRKTLHISPSTTLQQLIEAASERLNLEAKDVKVYTADGQDIDDIAFIRNNDVLYLIDKNKPFLRAKGEDFVGSYVVGEFLGQGIELRNSSSLINTSLWLTRRVRESASWRTRADR